MKKNISLYNMILPVWIVWLFPPIILLCIVLNTLIDFLVVYLSARAMKIESRKELIKKSLLGVVLRGFGADLIGVFVLLLMTLLSDYLDDISYFDDMGRAIAMNPFSNILALIVVVVAVLISGYFIYLFNYTFSFKKLDYLSNSQRKKLALYLALFTMPYTFLIPTAWVYNF